MGLFSHNHDSDETQAPPPASGSAPGDTHHASITHEALAGAAAYAAAKEYEKHVTENGQPPSHARAKEILAAFTAAFIDREVESKGLDYVDKEKAKHDAKKQAEASLAGSGGN